MAPLSFHNDHGFWLCTPIVGQLACYSFFSDNKTENPFMQKNTKNKKTFATVEFFFVCFKFLGVGIPSLLSEHFYGF